MLRRRGSKAIVVLCCAIAAPVVAYATDTPGCMAERYLALRTFDRDTQVRCSADDRSVSIPTPGGIMRASKSGDGWLVATPKGHYRVSGMDGVTSILDGTIPADAVPFVPDPDVGA
jgi:hypothetical protein